MKRHVVVAVLEVPDEATLEQVRAYAAAALRSWSGALSSGVSGWERDPMYDSEVVSTHVLPGGCGRREPVRSRVVAMLARGAKPADVAKEVGVSAARVYQIRAEVARRAAEASE